MRKILVVAQREYKAAVQSKAFVLTLILMPVLMGGSIAISLLLQKVERLTEKQYAVIDRTPGQQLALFLQKAVEVYNGLVDAEPQSGKPKFRLEIIPPSPYTPEAMVEQRFQLSQRIENGDLAAVLEIGPRVLEIGARFPDPQKVDDANAVRFQSKSPLGLSFRWLSERIINEAVQLQRFQAKNISILDVEQIQRPVVFKSKALTQRDPETGQLADAGDQTQLVNLFLPGALIALMFVVIMVGATPAMQGVVEEKSQRIAEVLLGSVTPFQLMAGKLIGVIGVSLTMALVYLLGGLGLTWHFGFADLLTPGLIAWFLVMLLLALFIYGSLFLAVGAAATNIKDTQTLLMPLMFVATLPLFALGAIMQDPNGVVAQICSFFPLAAPMVLVARTSVPPGVPTWEMVLGIALVLATTLFCVWAAGRVFRIGILLQGKSPRMTDLIRWVIRG